MTLRRIELERRISAPPRRQRNRIPERRRCACIVFRASVSGRGGEACGHSGRSTGYPRLSSSRCSSAMYRYARGAPGPWRGPFSLPPSIPGVRRVRRPSPPRALPRRGTRKRAPEASTAQRANLGCSVAASLALALSLEEPPPRLISLSLPSRVSSRVLATSARASFSYIALAFVLIIFNGAAARERSLGFITCGAE